MGSSVVRKDFGQAGEGRAARHRCSDLPAIQPYRQPCRQHATAQQLEPGPPAPTFFNASSAKRGWPTRRKSSSARSAGLLICPVKKPLQGKPMQPSPIRRTCMHAGTPDAHEGQWPGIQLRCLPIQATAATAAATSSQAVAHPPSQRLSDNADAQLAAEGDDLILRHNHPRSRGGSRAKQVFGGGQYSWAAGRPLPLPPAPRPLHSVEQCHPPLHMCTTPLALPPQHLGTIETTPAGRQ
jgi:hypothetical protein